MAKQCLTRCMGKYFLARLPPKGRSKRDASVGVLVSRNGGHRKILPEKVDGGRVFQQRL